ncbi:MAG: PAS domain-containing sensor histidine kinase [Phycisphaerales bacterium]
MSSATENAGAGGPSPPITGMLSVQDLMLLYAAAQENLWVWDMATNLTISSLPMTAPGGRTGDIRPTREWEDALHPEDRPRVLDALSAHLRREAPYEVEYRLRRADGVFRYVRSRGQAIFDERGRAIRMIGSMADVNDRREAEDRLRSSEHKYRSLIEATKTGYHVCDERGVTLDANPEFARMAGYLNVAEVLGRNVEELVDPQERESVRLAVERCLRDGRLVGFEATLLHPSGVRCPIEATSTVVAGEGDSGTIGTGKRQLVTLVRDATERRRLTAERDELAQRHALLVRRAPLGLIIWSTEGTVQEWNPAAERIFGYSAERAMGNDLGFIVPAAIRTNIRQLFARLVTRAGGEHNRNVNLHSSGREIVCDWFNTPLVDDLGRVFGVASLVDDVTEEVRALAELRQRETDLRLITGSIPAMIAYVDRDLCYRFANEAYREWQGIDPTQLVGKHIETVIGRELLEKSRPYIEGVLKGIPQRFERTLRDKTGRMREAESTFVPRVTEQGIEGFFVLSVDITDRKAAEHELAVYRDQLSALVTERTRQLAQQGEQLRQAERMASLGTLAAGLGHDINNLLLPMRCLIDALSARPEDPTQNIASLRQSLEFLANLSHSLLALAVAPDDAAQGRDNTSVKAWWAGAEPMLRAAMPETCTLAAEIEPGTADLAISPVQLTRAVLNLVVNACEAGGAGVRVKVRVQPEEDARGAFASVSVSDNGPGMSEEVRRHAREPFFTTKRRAISTGLGLPLVSAIVENARGNLEIQSTEAKGTTVRLRIPTLPPDSGAGSPPPPDMEVFLTIDDKRIASYLATLLAANGHTIRTHAPPPGVGRGAWIAQNSTQFRARAREFTSREGGRVVILLGAFDTQSECPGVVCIDDPSDIHAITAALHEPRRA